MEKFTFFWNGPFSQWYPSVFKLEGKTFSCAEQYMMYKKAMYFGDAATAEKILKTNSPRDQKALGRTVKGFDDEKWSKVARDIVYEGNIAKFSQNPELLRELKSKKGTSFVEASPYDTIWGIGLKEDDPLARNRFTWRGKNWLGETLDKVLIALES